MASFGAFLTYRFFFITGRRKDKADVNTLNISEFISKCMSYIYIYIIHIFITELSAWWFLCNLTLYKVTSSS